MLKFYFYQVFVFLLLTVSGNVLGQCMVFQVSLTQRVNQSAYIIQGKVTEQHCYIDATTGSVNTLNKISVNAWLKNNQNLDVVYLITMGGVLGNRATKVFPSLQVEKGNEYIFFLEKENRKTGDQNFHAQHPDLLQLQTYADAQGVMLYQKDGYHDMFVAKPVSEIEMFQRIAGISGERALTSVGLEYNSKKEIVAPIILCGLPTIDIIVPSTTNAGTIVPQDFVTAHGICLYGDPFYADANTANANIGNTVLSDLIYAVPDHFIVKVPEEAGTGFMGTFAGGFPGDVLLTINFSHLSINSNYSGYSEITRQRYYLRNINGSGGYSFLYNNTFNTNTAAANSFSRAIATWRCATGVNIRAAGTTAISTVAADGSSVVMFDNTLPAGVLARTTSQFNGDATATCNLANTVWYLSESDFQFNDPPKAGFTWQYGPALPSASQYDFESICLHELGHAIGLGHRKAIGEVMHYTIAPATSSRTPFTHEIEGVVNKLSYSTTPTCFNPVGSGTPMIPANCALPVTMGVLTGIRLDKNTDQLNWNTYQEINNRGFSIQRSADGQNFSTIGFVDGAINSSTEKNYVYKDIQAGELPWFYRLLITGLDGQAKISSTVYIPGYKNTDWKVWLTEKDKGINVYRNPAIIEKGTFQLFSSSGQLMFANTINSGNTLTIIPLNNFAKGIYYYRLISNSTTLSGKLIFEY